MSNFLIFVTYALLHAPFLILESQETRFDPPPAIVVIDDQVFPVVPCLALGGTLPKGFKYEVEQITPYGKITFRIVTTDRHLVPMYGASCYVRVRMTNGTLHSEWGDLLFVKSF